MKQQTKALRRRENPPGMVHDKNRRLVPIDPDQDKPFLAFLGGIERQELVEALKTSEDDRFRELVAAMADARFRNLSLVTMFRKCAITLHDAQEFWRNVKLQEGIARMMKHVPQSLEDTAIDAFSGVDLCERCMGLGEIVVSDARRQCPKCKGTGEVRVPGSKIARELIFEASGLTGKGVPLVAIQQNFGQGLDTLEQTSATVQKMISGEKKA